VGRVPEGELDFSAVRWECIYVKWELKLGTAVAQRFRCGFEVEKSGPEFLVRMVAHRQWTIFSKGVTLGKN